jgi:hypothetical protein
MRVFNVMLQSVVGLPCIFLGAMCRCARVCCRDDPRGPGGGAWLVKALTERVRKLYLTKYKIDRVSLLVLPPLRQLRCVLMRDGLDQIMKITVDP